MPSLARDPEDPVVQEAFMKIVRIEIRTFQLHFPMVGPTS